MSHAHLDSDIFRNIPRPGEMESNNMYHVFLCLYLKKKSLGLFCPQVNHDQFYNLTFSALTMAS